MSMGIGFLTWYSKEYYENSQDIISELYALGILQNKKGSSLSYKDHMAIEKWVWCGHCENFRSREIKTET